MATSRSKLSHFLQRQEKDNLSPPHLAYMYALENCCVFTLVASAPLVAVISLIVSLIIFAVAFIRSADPPNEIKNKIKEIPNLPSSVIVRQNCGWETSLYSIPYFSILVLPKVFSEKFSEDRIQHEIGHHKMMDLLIIVFLVCSAAFSSVLLIVSVILYCFGISQGDIEPLVDNNERVSLFTNVTYGLFGSSSILLLRSILHRREYFADSRAAYILPESYESFLKSGKMKERYLKQKNKFDKILNRTLHPSFGDRLDVLTNQSSGIKFSDLTYVTLVSSISIIFVLRGIALETITNENFYQVWAYSYIAVVRYLACIAALFITAITISRFIERFHFSNCDTNNGKRLIIATWLGYGLVPVVFMILRDTFLFGNVFLAIKNTSLIMWPSGVALWFLTQLLMVKVLDKMKVGLGEAEYDIAALATMSLGILTYQLLSDFYYLSILSFSILYILLMLCIIPLVVILMALGWTESRVKSITSRIREVLRRKIG